MPWTASHTAEGVAEIVLQYHNPDLWTCPYLILLRWNQAVYHRYSWYSWQLGVLFGWLLMAELYVVSASGSLSNVQD